MTETSSCCEQNFRVKKEQEEMEASFLNKLAEIELS